MDTAVLNDLPRVLLVEDSLPIRQRLRSLVTESGLAQVVAEASSVKSALAEFERMAPDAVVLDLQLTDGTGYTVLEAIKRSRPSCRVIVMANFAEAESQQRCLEMGADHFLEKSTDFERVPALLAGHALRPAAAWVAAVAATPRPRVERHHPEQHYRHVMESVAVAVYTCDAQGRITFYNAAAAELWGREPILGEERWGGALRRFTPAGQALPTDDRPMVLAIRTGQAVRGREIIIERPDGTQRHVLTHPQPLFDAAGTVTGVVNMLIDVTPLRLAEAAREQAQVNARTTLDSLTASICVLDEHGTIVSTNAAWRAFGRANGGLAAGINEGASYLRACDQGAAGAAVGALALGAALREVLAGRLERFDGEYPCHSPTEQRWFTVRITPLARSHPVHVVITHVDITERKSTELALLESERRWQFAVEGAGDGLWDRDLVSHRTTYSRRWKEMLGYAEHEIGDAPDEWASRVHPDDREQALALSQACHQGRVPSFSCEFRMRCKDGNWKWILDRGTVATRAADGTPLRMIGTHSDISERKQAEATRAELEAQLREAQKMEVVGTLASSIAHDFNNIMGAVLGNVALALEALEPQHPAAGYLDQLQKAGLRARSLVQKILSTSRRQHQAMQPQWLQPLVEQDIELLRATLPRGVTLEARVSSAALSADVDATQLNQVLLNLGTNAWHALQGAPGRVEIGLEALSARAEGGSESRNEGGAVFDGRPATACAHLWVRDEGCGMDEAIRARIFEPFFTTKAVGRGTGLGLAMVQRIVHAHRGTIGVDTVPGQGSCFHVYLPLTPMPDLALQGKDGGDTAAADLATACGQHVMYIDDDEFMTMLVADLLPRAGLRVTCFEAAEQALAALRAAPDSFELVITDFNMPRQSGLDVAKAIALMRPGLPVIITSGQITDELVEGARQAGVCGLVNKERTFEDLAAETLRVLARL